jgi:hypothetical protein
MSPLTRIALVAALETAAACSLGCVIDAPSPAIGSAGDSTATAVAAITDPTCPDWGCGMNSPTLADGVAFDELDSAGAPDRAGIKIVSARQFGKPVQIKIVRHFITAVALDGSGTVFEHGNLVGTVIELDKGGTSYGLKIDDVQEQSLAFWAGDTGEFVPFYRILVRLPLDNAFKAPICKPSLPDAVWGPVEHYAIAFTGDRYEPVRKRVADAGRGTTWFNLACAGTATAKMHLVRHTNAGAWTLATWDPSKDVLDPGAPFRTRVAQRQAMLKMYAADYCGDGTAYTVDGRPLLYDDENHWYAPPPPVPPLGIAADGSLTPAGAAIEALWTAEGAACLTTPRMVRRSAVTCASGAAISQCTPARVRAWAVNPEKMHVISANPPLP